MAYGLIPHKASHVSYQSESQSIISGRQGRQNEHQSKAWVIGIVHYCLTAWYLRCLAISVKLLLTTTYLQKIFIRSRMVINMHRHLQKCQILHDGNRHAKSSTHLFWIYNLCIAKFLEIVIHSHYILIRFLISHEYSCTAEIQQWSGNMIHAIFDATEQF